MKQVQIVWENQTKKVNGYLNKDIVDKLNDISKKIDNTNTICANIDFIIKQISKLDTELQDLKNTNISTVKHNRTIIKNEIDKISENINTYKTFLSDLSKNIDNLHQSILSLDIQKTINQIVSDNIEDIQNNLNKLSDEILRIKKDQEKILELLEKKENCYIYLFFRRIMEFICSIGRSLIKL